MKDGRGYRYYVSRDLVEVRESRLELDGVCPRRNSSGPLSARREAYSMTSRRFSPNSRSRNRTVGGRSDIRDDFRVQRTFAGRDGIRCGPGRSDRKGTIDRGGFSRLPQDIRTLWPDGRPCGCKDSPHLALRADELKRRGVELRIILGGKDEIRRKVDPALLKAIARARRWFEEVASGRVPSLAAIARREHLAKRDVARLTKLAFIAPSIVEAVVEGWTPAALNLQMLMDPRFSLPLGWKDQERLLEFQQ